MNNTKSNILGIAAMNAALTALYIVLIGTFFRNAERIFGGGEDTLFVPIAMLLLFVVSASVTGGLVLGRPILWYLDGKKKEAVKLFAFTVACLAVLTLVAFGALIIFR